LSNTDSIHINHFKVTNGDTFYNRFYNCFEKVYFSFDLGSRKPDEEIYNFVIKENNLNPKKTLFVDDNLDNIKGAKKTGLQVWHLQKGKEDVIELFEKVKL
jgi:putative hydrolase of the HAD superfamily